MPSKLRFQPVSHSWVALHPNPKGVIQFVGGAFFGTFGPMFFYRHLLQYFFDQSYTIILLPFSFSFNHYREAIFLVKEQYHILPDLVRLAMLEGYDYQVYLRDDNYYWVAHSIGCKYVSLLEAFSALPDDREAAEQFIRTLIAALPEESYRQGAVDRVVTQIGGLIDDLESEAKHAKQLIHTYQQSIGDPQDESAETIFLNLFIKNQPSILIAPCTSDTASAVRPKAFARLVDQWGLGVKPTTAATCTLIQKSDLFGLLGLVQFETDKIAKTTCQWFLEEFGKPTAEGQRNLLGGHLRPLGWQFSDRVINPFFDWPMINSTAKRNAALEDYMAELLDCLSARRRDNM